MTKYEKEMNKEISKIAKALTRLVKILETEMKR